MRHWISIGANSYRNTIFFYISYDFHFPPGLFFVVLFKFSDPLLPRARWRVLLVNPNIRKCRLIRVMHKGFSEGSFYICVCVICWTASDLEKNIFFSEFQHVWSTFFFLLLEARWRFIFINLSILWKALKSLGDKQRSSAERTKRFSFFPSRALTCFILLLSSRMFFSLFCFSSVGRWGLLLELPSDPSPKEGRGMMHKFGCCWGLFFE